MTHVRVSDTVKETVIIRYLNSVNGIRSTVQFSDILYLEIVV